MTVFNRVHRVWPAQHADPIALKPSLVPNRLTGNAHLVCRVAAAILIFRDNAAVSAHLSVYLVITAHPISTCCRIATPLVSTVFVVTVLIIASNVATLHHACYVYLLLFCQKTRVYLCVLVGISITMGFVRSVLLPVRFAAVLFNALSVRRVLFLKEAYVCRTRYVERAFSPTLCHANVCGVNHAIAYLSIRILNAI